MPNFRDSMRIHKLNTIRRRTAERHAARRLAEAKARVESLTGEPQTQFAATFRDIFAGIFGHRTDAEPREIGGELMPSRKPH